MTVPPILGHNPDGLTKKFMDKPPLVPSEITVTEV